MELLTEKGFMTKDGEEFEKIVRAALRPLMQEYFNYGYRPQDIQTVINDFVMMEISEIRLLDSIKKTRKIEKNES